MNNEELYESYRLPTELSAETKLSVSIFQISVRILISVGLLFFFAFKTADRIYEPLQIVYYVFNIIVGLVLVIKSKRNIQKSLLTSFILMITADKHYYAPIDSENKEKEVEVRVNETPD